ncbi:unnamed protein product [Nippostrongylus brasiliensis]|uniref:JmjC domain-containing protein n=1 Tax=Nippostrongylus brasiliensis TaxID=27835 RepID=A0A0N4Y5A3_NIPBR|nr:unnamed protein product [Nippostrongylus brasiliensis]
MLLLLLICLPIHAEVALEGDGGWVTDKKDVVGQEGPCNIERHDARELTEKEFLHRYAYAEPVIIYNIDNEEFREKTAKQRMIDDWKDSPKPTTFGDYVETQLKAQNRDTLGNETMYLFGDIDQTLWAPLLQSYKLPKWSLPGHKPALSFGIAGAGTGVPFHFHGPGFAEYPALPREKRPLECLMKPGEVIYFPDKWWHATLNTETSVFISTFLSP